MDFGDRTGVPPTADDFRAALAGKIPADMPVTAQLMEEIAKLAEQKIGDGPRADAARLSVIINAITSLERRIADLEGS
ncbi:hypothetical protein [Mycobacteroides abscessus]|uniref:hypothetical protein n=1 Tax=Mycobacteroides abscessus TaxID=36809 RepID=UPI00148F74CF|nr:hypothetical protein [Mycobacteroides abscessus subsp. abscessus]NOS01078.1 hypothetical protein [Mycobacteroides abscessus]